MPTKTRSNRERDPDLCPVQWEIGRWPWVSSCVEKKDTPHEHRNKDGLAPLNGNYYIMRSDDIPRIFKNGEEILPLSIRVGADGGTVLVCTIHHGCGLRFPLGKAPRFDQERFDQALKHVRDGAFASTQL